MTWTKKNLVKKGIFPFINRKTNTSKLKFLVVFIKVPTI